MSVIYVGGVFVFDIVFSSFGVLAVCATVEIMRQKLEKIFIIPLIEKVEKI